MKDGDEEKIKSNFSQYTPIIDSDINISLDQTRKLRAAISADSTFAYPLPEPNGSFNVDEVLGFLIRLGEIFDWKRYEYSTLGKCDEDGDYTKLRWYAVILVQWMKDKGLNYIMRRAVEYQERHPEKFWINKYTKMYYNKESLEHRNIVFANTLEVIENVILFSISNYFLRFSNEYKRVHGEKSLTGIIGMSMLNTALPMKPPFSCRGMAFLVNLHLTSKRLHSTLRLMVKGMFMSKTIWKTVVTTKLCSKSQTFALIHRSCSRNNLNLIFFLYFFTSVIIK